MDAVTATDVEFRYGTHRAIGSSSFAIPAGTLTAVIGPNGSGKSTLIKAIAGLIEPTSGSLTVHTASDPNRIALVLQMTKVNDTLPVTVREAVAMGRFASIGQFTRLSNQDWSIVDEAMERLGISDLSGRHLSELSGGQRQRVFVAQGFAQDHDILLLDEPLTGLDLPSAHAIDEEVHKEMASGRTVIMSTHNLAEAHLADHVVLLGGRVVASGPATGVLTTENLQEAYGSALLHVEGERVSLLDDPAHQPAVEHHTHQDRSIHVEAIHEDSGS